MYSTGAKMTTFEVWAVQNKPQIFGELLALTMRYKLMVKILNVVFISLFVFFMIFQEDISEQDTRMEIVPMSPQRVSCPVKMID